MVTDNIIRNEEFSKNHCHHLLHIHWAAIIAGGFVGLGLGFLLNLFSMAIGLSAYSSTPNGATVLAIGGLLGLLIGVIVSMGAAGFVTGYLGRSHHSHCQNGIIYGFITWSLALMLSAVLIIPLSHYISFYEENLNASAVTTEVSTSTTASNTEGSVVREQNKITTPAATVNPKNLAWSSWVIFILFFIGALSSCIGACYGMCCKKGEGEGCHIEGHHHHHIPPQDIPDNRL